MMRGLFVLWPIFDEHRIALRPRCYTVKVHFFAFLPGSMLYPILISQAHRLQNMVAKRSPADHRSRIMIAMFSIAVVGGLATLI
jgi:hypothetical protein